MNFNTKYALIMVEFLLIWHTYSSEYSATALTEPSRVPAFSYFAHRPNTFWKDWPGCWTRWMKRFITSDHCWGKFLCTCDMTRRTCVWTFRSHPGQWPRRTSGTKPVNIKKKKKIVYNSTDNLISRTSCY